jgi:hypothetical protein
MKLWNRSDQIKDAQNEINPNEEIIFNKIAFFLDTNLNDNENIPNIEKASKNNSIAMIVLNTVDINQSLWKSELDDPDIQNFGP